MLEKYIYVKTVKHAKVNGYKFGSTGLQKTSSDIQLQSENINKLK